VRGWGAVLAAAGVLATACAHSAADHEELGDRAYAAGAYRDALAEYQLALKTHKGTDLLAKAGAAALHAEDYTLAAAEYRALGERDPSRAGEAAVALERVVRAAVAANDRAAVASALAAVRAVAPDRPLGKYARLVALDAAADDDSAAALALLPVAVAAAPDGRSSDSLLYLYGMAAARAHDCDTAVPVFEGVLRRQREPAVIDGAREGLGLCALVEGQALLNQGRPADAESWFKRATAPGAAPEVSRAAYLGLGDVRLARGDLSGALEGYHQALAGGSPGDSITVRAEQKINALGKVDGAAAPPPKQL
jgi:tetratricopeptide (TPR) repeat protein